MTSGLETEPNYSGRKGRDGQNKKTDKVNKKRKREKEKESKLEMWANAQRDGRLAEYRWRPPFNAAKFG